MLKGGSANTVSMVSLFKWEKLSDNLRKTVLQTRWYGMARSRLAKTAGHRSHAPASASVLAEVLIVSLLPSGRVLS
jgi:hypothetical protein